VSLRAADDRGLAIIRVLSGESVLTECDPKPQDTLSFATDLSVQPPPIATLLTVEVVDNTGHHVRRDVELHLHPGSPAPPKP